jgi:hypothetical protein
MLDAMLCRLERGKHSLTARLVELSERHNEQNPAGLALETEHTSFDSLQ